MTESTGKLVVLCIRLAVPAAMAMFCLVFLYQILPMSELSSFYPKLLIVLLLAVFVPFLVVSELRAYRAGTFDAAEVQPKTHSVEWGVMAVLVGLLAAWTLLFGRIGFFLGSLLVFWGMALTLMRVSLRNLAKLAIVSLVFMAFVMFLFSYLLEIPLPTSAWGL